MQEHHEDDSWCSFLPNTRWGNNYEMLTEIQVA